VGDEERMKIPTAERPKPGRDWRERPPLREGRRIYRPGRCRRIIHSPVENRTVEYADE
jgi:hypothetical protein